MTTRRDASVSLLRIYGQVPWITAGKRQVCWVNSESASKKTSFGREKRHISRGLRPKPCSEASNLSFGEMLSNFFAFGKNEAPFRRGKRTHGQDRRFTRPLVSISSFALPLSCSLSFNLQRKWIGS